MECLAGIIAHQHLNKICVCIAKASERDVEPAVRWIHHGICELDEVLWVGRVGIGARLENDSGLKRVAAVGRDGEGHGRAAPTLRRARQEPGPGTGYRVAL